MLDAERGGLKAGAVLSAGAFALCERHTRAARGVCVPSLVRPVACLALLRFCSVLSMLALYPVCCANASERPDQRLCRAAAAFLPTFAIMLQRSVVESCSTGTADMC